MTGIAKLMLTGMVTACLTCRAEPAAGPTHKAVVICFNGGLDSGNSCSTACFQPDGKLHPTGRMSCGWPGKVSEIEWRFLRRNGNADLYEFTRRFPADKAGSRTETSTVEFGTARVVVFKDASQAIVIEGPKAASGEAKPAPHPRRSAE